MLPTRSTAVLIAFRHVVKSAPSPYRAWDRQQEGKTISVSSRSIPVDGRKRRPLNAIDPSEAEQQRVVLETSRDAEGPIADQDGRAGR